jgi:hypothetical protein
MGRARWHAAATTSVACLVAALLGGCAGTGSRGATTVTVTAAGRSSAVSTRSPAPTAAAPITTTTTPTPTAESTAAPTTEATTAAAAGAHLRISHRLVPDGSGRPLLLPVFTVDALTNDPVTARAARALHQALAEQVRAVVAGWEAAAEAGSTPQGSIRTDQVAVPVNEAELAVVAWRASVYTGGAHPVEVLRSVTVDVAHGRTVTDAALLGQLQHAGGPAWDFERELRRAVRQRWPDLPEVDSLTRAELHVYPTRAGLHVTGDQCVLACALPPLEVTLAWDRLVGPRDDIDALPDAWGL